MGDVILFEKDENQESYLVMINYRKGKTKVVASKYSLFLRFLEEEEFRQKALDWLPYPVAIEKYEEPEYNDCFGYTPLLGLDGAEKFENLKKVKLKEHILIITEFMGPVLCLFYRNYSSVIEAPFLNKEDAFSVERQ